METKLGLTFLRKILITSINLNSDLEVKSLYTKTNQKSKKKTVLLKEDAKVLSNISPDDF